ncbi:hypothetical protein [Shewanella mesophila]|uniref:hypothetical protein n=1 Tax=Shewanella mesophila TaxID=2864208 RepID=UPI0021ACE3BD|nr:hypothetical protein [Shewanella mesophila]
MMKHIFNAICAKGLPARDLKNANKVNLLALLWVASLALSSYLLKQEPLSASWLVATLFVVHSTIGILMILAYKRFLTQLDEMERKIQLDALALAVGVTIVGFSSYSVLDLADMVPDLKASYVIVSIAVTYMVGIISGRVRYG